ncbi:putative ribosome biogenesis GTPase RsgA [Clostridium sp. CAG:508]|jgi:ribosome biogenesis GTPase|nr:putative ribosome biogenesis GTPase RsgA [Clostridium sp. CAG:508]
MPKGIIICTSSNVYQVAEGEKIYKCLARGKFKKEKISPLVGDEVEFTITNSEKQEGVIEQILPRKNELKRPKMANLTQLILVVSMKMPSPDLLLLDKQLVFAEFMGLKATIVLNKVDLEDKEEIDRIAKLYEDIGYKIIQTNAKEGIKVEEIKALLEGETTAFAGNSGVGKSTLINSIFEQELTQEGDISDKNQRGKNTTTSTTLYKYKENSYIADTPGFSTFEINEIPKEDLCHYFVEFVPYLDKCEFQGCSHIKEENCGVKEALEAGKISSQRYENYIKIYNNLS